MNRTDVIRWLTALGSEFIEGCADAFLIVSGGAAAAQAGALQLPTLTLAQLGYSVLLGGLWYAAAFLKKTPLPTPPS